MLWVLVDVEGLVDATDQIKKREWVELQHHHEKNTKKNRKKTLRGCVDPWSFNVGVSW